MSRLVTNGFDTWDKMLLISEDDLERLDIKLGHRRKLQRKVQCYNDDLIQESSCCDKDLLAHETIEWACADPLGQSWKQSAFSTSSSSSNGSGHATRSAYSESSVCLCY